MCRNAVGGALSLADGDTDRNDDGKLDEGVRVSRGAMVEEQCVVHWMESMWFLLASTEKE